jgi:site-specific DNA recombinase
VRAAIYARMSTDKQSAASPEDQIARCRAYAEREGWEVVLVESDAGISGASRHNRPGLLSLMSEIESWDVLLVWDSSRIARDSEDLGWVRKRLRFHRRRGFEVASGLGLENVGSKVMGVLAEEYLVKLREDTLRGLYGRAERSLATGAPPFGYRTEEATGGGRRVVIDEAEAVVVRRMFELYLEGEGLRALAVRFNTERIPAPRPRALRGRPASWSPSAMRSMLLNPFYRGEITWNRSEWRKDPDTGTRKRIERPRSEWITRHDEALRIIPDDVFERVGATMTQRGAECREPTRAGARRGGRPRYLLAGVLACGECGGSFHVVHGGRGYGCSWRHDRGPAVCGFRTTIDRTELEERLLGALRDRILTAPRVAYVVERAVARVRERLAGDGPDGERERARLVEIDRALEALVRQVAKLGEVDGFDRIVTELRTERAQITRRLAAPTTVPDLSPEQIRDAAERGVVRLRDSLSAAPEIIRGALRSMLGGDRIRVVPRAEDGYQLEGIFRLGLEAETPPSSNAREWRFCVVAGAGFEPATSGL